MSFPPPNATLSGVAPLVAPFTSPITFYAIPTPTSVLLYSFGQVSTLSNNKLATITAGDAASAVTVHFLLNYGGNYIDWFSQPASITDPVAIAAIQRTTIQIVQVIASSALTPSTSMTTAAGGPSVNGAPIAPTVNSATITPSVSNTPISSATPKVSSPTSVQQSHGISSGAAAGVAIGCLIAGALIAGLILWFCWGRRKAQRSRYSEAGAISLTPFEKGPLAHNMFLGSGSPAQLGAITGLPQPLEDQAISGEVSKISNLIKNHVQSYYHNRIVSPGIIGINGVVELGEDLPFPTGTLSTLLDDITTREVALRFSIAWAIISRLQNYDDPSRTLLPHELCESLRNITKAEHGSKGNIVDCACCSNKADLCSSYLSDCALASLYSRTNANCVCRQRVHCFRLQEQQHTDFDVHP